MTLSTVDSGFSASPAWVEPTFSAVYIPSLQSISLTEAERAMISRLQMRSYRLRQSMLLNEAYYQGQQIITNLGIALPPELDGLRVILGWPRIGVDPFVERLQIDSFRRADKTSSDSTLDDLRQATDMAGEEILAFTDALVLGRAFWLMGTPQEKGDAPDIMVESPLNIAADWDLRTRDPLAILQSYFMDEKRYAALYLPDQTIHIGQDDNATWQLIDRDVHNMGEVPVVMMPNRPRASTRHGLSEITPELMSITDAACRTLINLTAASEFYSVPQKLILGATEEDFISADGSKKTAWETYIGRVLALQRDSEGALPEVKQFDAYDPSIFTTVVEMYASQAAGILAAPPQDLGLYTQGNPITAEAMQVSEARRDRRARRMQANFGPAMVKVAKWGLRFDNGGELPSGYDRLATDWKDPQIINFTGMADGMSKLMGEGSIPRGSDVALRRLGFNAIERRQMEAERKENPAEQLIDTLGQSVETKSIRMANAVIAAAQPTPDPAADPAKAATTAVANKAKAVPKPAPPKTPPTKK